MPLVSRQSSSRRWLDRVSRIPLSRVPSVFNLPASTAAHLTTQSFCHLHPHVRLAPQFPRVGCMGLIPTAFDGSVPFLTPDNTGHNLTPPAGTRFRADAAASSSVPATPIASTVHLEAVSDQQFDKPSQSHPRVSAPHPNTQSSSSFTSSCHCRAEQ